MPENLIRLKQLNQPEITGLFQNIISSNSYALTYNGGTGLNIGNVAEINLNNLNININDSILDTKNTRTNLNDRFPPATGIRRYHPIHMQSTTTSQPGSGIITYFPFLIQKRAIDPNICIEMTNYAGADTPIKVGIYSGNNGFESARLFWSGTIPIALSSTGINRIKANISLNQGAYIAASMNIAAATNVASFRVMNVNFIRQVIGENTGVPLLGAGTANATTYHIYETGIDLRSVIGTGLWSTTSAGMGPLVCLEY